MNQNIGINVNIINKPPKNIEEDIKLNNTRDVLELKEVQAIRNAIREHLLFIGLDNRNNVRNISLLGIGNSNGITIDSKEIIRVAFDSASDKVILIHNHPSNSLTPSKEDINLTNVSSEILKAFEIKLQDHIIVTENDFMSMAKIQEFIKENNIESISNMEKGLLLEENERLKQRINELEQNIVKNKNNDFDEIEYGE